ncbi:phosphoribosyl-AMP cyclohydrolase [Sphingobium nicotianae]|uniref:Phosphoribosyl-AMP cyclohydrolase n=1 Tax=Sphingobium nicotianae TaxID=2782607 RepID=A0A9X1DBU5_9SPHN|nr:phosphoribosyl-AMP cyclohydrolase [Sphingobium nicotianae]MBT2187117.1 phosphoribosyl-AMP cyclohydrolase [Sphingobium nicotianae]
MADTRDTGLALDPKYDRDGLITAVASDAQTGELLMLAHMNADAFAATVETGVAHFWSRSRSKLWRKGEESGNELRVVDMRIDCDQDALWLIVQPAGPACHTGRRSCFYRRVTKDGLSWIDEGAGPA